MPMHRVAIIVLASLAAAAQEPLGSAEKVAAYSIEKEAALGRQLAADFRRRNTTPDSPAVQDYLERLGRRIATGMRAAKSPAASSEL